MKVTVTVRPRAGILDPQGEALRRSLQGLGYAASDVRAGKVFDLELDVGDAREAVRVAGQIAEQVLSNPLIEEFEVAQDRCRHDRSPGRRVSVRVGVLAFPGSCDDRDALRAVELDGRPSRCASGTPTPTLAAPRR